MSFLNFYREPYRFQKGSVYRFIAGINKDSAFLFLTTEHDRLFGAVQFAIKNRNGKRYGFWLRCRGFFHSNSGNGSPEYAQTKLEYNQDLESLQDHLSSC